MLLYNMENNQDEQNLMKRENNEREQDMKTEQVVVTKKRCRH